MLLAAPAVPVLDLLCPEPAIRKLVQQQVPRLDVAMDHTTPVHVRKPFGILLEQAKRPLKVDTIWQISKAALIGKLIHEADGTIRAVREAQELYYHSK